MPGTGLVIENSEMNKTWVDISRLVRKFTCELGSKRSMSKAYALAEYEVDNCPWDPVRLLRGGDI